MVVLIAMAAAFWAVLALGPRTPMGRCLHDWLVGAPARRLDRVTRRQVTLLVLMLAVTLAIAWASQGNELFRFTSFAAPDIVLWASTIELGTLVDLFTATALTAATLRIIPLLRGLRRPRGHAPRAARCPATRAANDDGDVDSRRAA